ncbi:penicillin-binding protein activator [Marinobacterium marinum]|uniref:Penicillin-binding protein activator n=1 Tax=Marinobacterium marinum TaxID=2756129 RepID=A0A7W1WY96_9GAMM|nr:penicillin-binding protein activator [Marinobacterium marinum]MBA4502473.1 penicillin-binding protein activator [Marinobacterium marinum]
MTILHRLSFSLLLATTLLAGCSSHTTSPEVVDRTATTSQNIEGLLRKAETLPATPAADLKLQAARMLAQNGDETRAVDILDSINLAQIPPTLAFEVAKLKTLLVSGSEDPAEALKLLDPNRLGALPVAQQAELGQLRADIWLQQNNSIAAVRELIVSSLLTLDPTEQQHYHNRIWQVLQQTPLNGIKSATSANNNYQEQGWFELAMMLRSSTDMAGRQQALENWSVLWESHPALTLPPAGLMGLEFDGEQLFAQRIGVILPLSGDLAKPASAIRKGMEAQIEVMRREGKPVPQLIMFDSTGVTDVTPLLQQARQQAVDFLLGPLTPSLINQLSSLPEQNIPVLALNSAEAGPSRPWQLELSSEHEARMVVRRALADGHRNLLIISPAAEWGDRIADVMKEELESAGGQVTGNMRYEASGNYSDQIAELLQIRGSAERKKKLRHPSQFKQYRRQDADAILMTAQPDPARLIKPMLNYHFASDMPIYATSHLYPGSPNPVRDVDMDGITFCDLPWLLQPPSETHRLLNSKGEDTLSRFGRLFALGADAIKAYPWLPQLEQNPGSFLLGETGRLAMDSNKRLLRELSCTTFTSGTPASLTSSQAATNKN